jgi:hypothetical protein
VVIVSGPEDRSSSTARAASSLNSVKMWTVRALRSASSQITVQDSTPADLYDNAAIDSQRYGVRMLKGGRMSTGVAMHPP